VNPRRRGRAWLLTGLVAMLVVATGCIPPRPSPTPAPESTAAPIPTVAPPTTSTGSPAGSSGLVVDPSLLDLLPPDVNGVPLDPDPDTAAEIAADGSIGLFVSAVALAAAFGPIATDTAADYVVVTAARLKPGTFDELFFRGWRDTFDAAVCEQAGGVSGHAESDISGHHTYIGTCAGGVHTYHVHLPASDVIVSMQGTGEGRYGERVVAGLTE
jgi:hypothetical protein